MSSFVIGKQEYIKAAGLVAGLAKTLEIWNYNPETGFNSTPQDYYNKFVKFFEMNALSVAEQYHETAPYTDSNEYNDLFKKYQKAGETIGITREGLKEAVAELEQFFSSASYQTEYEPYMYAMDFYFNNLLVALYKKAYPIEAESWGEFKIKMPTSKVTRIM
jgi:hypothetical protein